MKHKKRVYKKRDSSVVIAIFLVLIYLMFSRIQDINISALMQLANKIVSYSPWIAITTVLILLLTRYVPLYLKKRKYRLAGINQINKMSGVEFEEFLKVYFRDLGYKVLNHKGGSRDKGADLLLYDSKGRKIVVQAKRYSTKVPFEAIQQVHTARSLYEADRAILVTNNYLTKQARETSTKLSIEVWEMDRLIENMYIYRKKKSKRN